MAAASAVRLLYSLSNAERKPGTSDTSSDRLPSREVNSCTVVVVVLEVVIVVVLVVVLSSLITVSICVLPRTGEDTVMPGTAALIAAAIWVAGALLASAMLAASASYLGMTIS